MLAGNPLRIEQGHGAGFYRHGHLHVKQPARRVTGVDAQADRSLAVKRSPHGGQECQRQDTHKFDFDAFRSAGVAWRRRRGGLSAAAGVA